MKLLRILALAEGISLLLLLFVAMPLKYGLDYPQAVEVVGMLHGILFIGYTLVLLMEGFGKGWPIGHILISFICAFLPFGTFYADKKYFKPRLAS